MDYAVVLSRADLGLRAPLVRVEVHLSSGLPAFTMVGMAETAVRESRDRVRSALQNCHFEFPDRRITVNLAPADLPKGGARFDLPIALGILCASGQLPRDLLRDTECFGELALDGGLRPIRGAVAATISATADQHRVALPLASGQRCARIPGATLIGADDLLSLCAILRGRSAAPALEGENQPAGSQTAELADLAGQRVPRRALEIAAAGAHNLLMIGPPGTGKSALARCLPGILPPTTEAVRLTTAALHDLLGESLPDPARPFRAPHHSASAPALIGGGSVPRPGEASLAHGGVLFLDELPEFSRYALEMLREPLETGEISLARARCRITYPARFQLLAAMNPCPCGYAGDPQRSCRCSPTQRQNYERRLSGPLLDRIDLHVRVDREPAADLFRRHAGESSAMVARRVRRCRELQTTRQGASNAQLVGAALLEACALGAPERSLLEKAADRLHLSARTVHRTLRVARTIADLGEQDAVTGQAIREALAYRTATTQAPLVQD